LAAIAVAALIVIVVAAAIVRRQEARSDDVHADATPKSTPDVFEATPDQLQQIRVEPVREQAIDMPLETTGKVGFNEDRMTPVFAPYGGRVLEVLANKGDVVQSGQPVLVIESPDLIATVNDLAEAHAEADKSKIALESAEKAAERAR